MWDAPKYYHPFQQLWATQLKLNSSLNAVDIDKVVASESFVDGRRIIVVHSNLVEATTSSAFIEIPTLSTYKQFVLT